MSLMFGMDKDLKDKADAKYDPELERQVTGWIESITGEQKGGASFAEWLKDGKVLCKLVNSIKPGSVKKVNESTLDFKKMENIKFFTDAARALGVPESAMFGTPDLYEEKNLGSVVSSLYALGGAVQVTCPEFTGPKLGVALTSAKANDTKRNVGLLTDQSGGYSSAMDVARPKDQFQARQGMPTDAMGRTGSGGGAANPRGPAPALEGMFKPGAAAPTPAPPVARANSPPQVAAVESDRAKNQAEGRPVGDHALNPARGLDAELQAKADAKYDVGLEEEVTRWIEAVTGDGKGEQSFQDWLKNGQVLCRLANAIRPGVIKKINDSKLAFKEMENITFFMNAARDMGVPELSMFGTPDLYEGKNLGTVVSALLAFGGTVQVTCPNYTGPKLGVAATRAVGDSKRAGGLLTDQSAGYAGKCEVERPTQGMKR
jgi:hypothetical protein